MTKPKQKEDSFFDVLNSILNKKNMSDLSISKHFNAFMANQSLCAIHPKVCYDCNFLNSARGNKYIPSEIEYKILKQTITAPRGSRISFDKKDKNRKIIIDALRTHFKESEEVIKAYLRVLPGEDILDILKKVAMFGNSYVSEKSVLELQSAILDKEEEILKGLK